MHELVAVTLQLGELEAVGAVRAADWPADADALADAAAGHRGRPLRRRARHPAGRLLRDDRRRRLAFDVSSLLPEAAEALLDRAAAGLADHLAAAAEPFLNAAQWAALANRELAGGTPAAGPGMALRPAGLGRGGPGPPRRDAPGRR